MNLRCRYAEDTIANFIAVVMKSGGGRASELIRCRRQDSSGSRPIRSLMAKKQQSSKLRHLRWAMRPCYEARHMSA